MDFKDLFRKKDGVSPVIGTVMLLAVTVILSVITVSSVSDMKASYPLSDVTIRITANSAATSTVPASVKLEHLAGDQIDFGDSTLMKVTASLNGAETITINATHLNILSIGDVKILPLTSDGTTNAFGTGPVSGDTITIKIIGLEANQIICSQEVQF